VQKYKSQYATSLLPNPLIQ